MEKNINLGVINIDITTYALLKKRIDSIVANSSMISDLSFNNNVLTLKTVDGKIFDVDIPIPEDGVSVIGANIDENNNLILEMSDGSKKNVGELPNNSDYTLLDNKPTIGGETVDGNKTLHDYGLPEIVESITETTDINSLATTGAINGLIANIPTSDFDGNYTSLSGAPVKCTVINNVSSGWVRFCIIEKAPVSGTMIINVSRQNRTAANNGEAFSFMGVLSYNLCNSRKEASFKILNACGIGSEIPTTRVIVPDNPEWRNIYIDFLIDSTYALPVNCEMFFDPEIFKNSTITCPMAQYPPSIDTVNHKHYTFENKVKEISVDSALSETSENPVQNKVVTEALADKADKSAVVSGIKGDAETEYRGGNVNITQENLGINYWTRRKQLTPDVWYRLYEIQDPTTGMTFALTIAHDYALRASESNCLAISVDSYRKSDDLSNISIKPLTDTLKAIDSSFKKLRICEIKGNTIYIDFMPTTSTEYFTCTLSPILQSSGYDSYTIVKSNFSENPTIPDGYNVYEYDFITKTISLPADGFVKNDPNVDLSNLMTQIAHPNNFLIYDDIGKPSTMVAIPKFYLDEVIDGASHTVHPAFIINGVEQDVIYISKYQNVVENGRAYSLPMKNPQTNVTFDQAYNYCKAKGAGWHLMTNAEWAAIALWCKKNSTMPKGNNNYGKDISETLTKAIPATKGSDGKTNKVLTGSGNADWYHDGTYAGIADLNGNVWEWVSGLCLVNGEIQIFADNDAADWNNSISADSSAWKAIMSDGTLVTPNAADTLKYDWASSKITLSKTITTQEDAQKATMFENLGLASGVTAPPLLKVLGLYPDSTGYVDDYMYINNVDERLSLRGGYWDNGALSGVFALSLAGPRPFAGSFVGFRAAYCNPTATTAIVSEEGDEINNENRTETINTEQVQQTSDTA